MIKPNKPKEVKASRKKTAAGNANMPTELERRIIKLLEQGPMLESKFVEIFGDKVVADAFITSRTGGPAIIERTVEKGVAFIQLVKRPIDPQATDWRLSDTEITKKLGHSKERFGQLRRELYWWSQVNWSKTDEEISDDMQTRLKTATGRKMSFSCNSERVRHYRSKQNWLQENRANFCRSPRFHKQDGAARQQLEQLETDGMTLEEIQAVVKRPKKWLRETLKELGKHYRVIEKKHHSSKWHWERVTKGEWQRIPYREIAEIVVDDEGNHPSVSVVVNYALRHGYHRYRR